MRTVRSWIAWGVLLFVCACGQGGHDTRALIHGTALIPGGTPASPTLTPVPAGTNVFVFKIDDTGNPVGNPLVQTTTDATGGFSFYEEDPQAHANDHIVQVTPEPMPQPVGLEGSANLEGPITGTVLQLDPAVELATRKMVAQLRGTPAGDTLANFTTDEKAAFVSLLQTSLLNDPGLMVSSDGTQVLPTEGTITKLDSVMFPDVVSDVLLGLVPPGSLPPSVIGAGGTYRIVELTARFDGTPDFDTGRSSSIGTLTIDGATGAVSLDVTRTRFDRHATCNAGPNDRLFSTDPPVPTGESTTGTVTVAGKGHLLFTFGADTVLGSVSADGTVIAMPFIAGRELGIRAAIKEGSAVTSATLGGLYSFGEFRDDLPPDGAASVTWDGFTCTLAQGVMGLVPVTASTGVIGGGVRSDAFMHAAISCVGTGCPLAPPPPPPLLLPLPNPSALVVFPLVPPAALTGGFAVSADGNLTLSEPGGTSLGQVAPSGEAFVLQRLSPAIRSVGIAVGTRQGAAMTNANLVGTYNVSYYEDLFNTDASVHGSVRTGVVTFSGTTDSDGNGSVSMVGSHVGFQRSPRHCGACGDDPVLVISDTFAGTGVYKVDPTGNVAINLASGFGPFPLSGIVSSPTAQVVVMGHVHDNAGYFGSARALIVATKQ